jgi:hypothetical protein
VRDEWTARTTREVRTPTKNSQRQKSGNSVNQKK